MKVFIGILLLLAALAGAGGILISEEQNVEFIGILCIFGGGVGYGLLAARSNR